MEITLRTCEALDAVRSVAEQVPDMAVGAGTIVRPEQAREAVSAGAAFLVSPGCIPHLLEAMLDQAVPAPLARRLQARRSPRWSTASPT